MTDKLLTVEETAERLGTSVRFVRRLYWSAGPPTSRSVAMSVSPPATWTPSSPLAGSMWVSCRPCARGPDDGPHREADAGRPGELAGTLPRPGRHGAQQDVPAQGRRGEVPAHGEARKQEAPPS
jgi:hypothetical protein